MTVEAARRLVERTTKAQGLPLQVEDRHALERVAAVLATSPKVERRAA